MRRNAVNRALVLGVGGFIGSHLARRLVAANWEVVGVLREPPTGARLERLGDTLSTMRLEIGDGRDGRLLARLVREADVIFPLAAQSGSVNSVVNPLADLQDNAFLQLELLEAVREVNPAARLIFPGSRLQYGRPLHLPVDEQHPQAPISIYGLHKTLADGYYALYNRIHGLSTVRLRISNPYGPHQYRTDRSFGLVGTFIDVAARDGDIVLYGGGTQLRDYIYIDDLIDVMILVGTHPGAVGKVFNIGGRAATSIREMAERVITVVGAGRIVDGQWPRLDGLVETGDYVTDISLATRDLGWLPRVELAEGLAETWRVQARSVRYRGDVNASR